MEGKAKKGKEDAALSINVGRQRGIVSVLGCLLVMMDGRRQIESSVLFGLRLSGGRD